MYELPSSRSFSGELQQRAADTASVHHVPVPLGLSYETLSGAAAADYVAAPATEITNGELLTAPLEDDGALLDKAEAVRAVLDGELDRQMNEITAALPEGRHADWRLLQFAVDQTAKGNWSRLEQYGLRVNPGWFRDTVRSMLQNRPVEVEIARTLRPSVAHGPAQEYVLNYDQQFDRQAIGLGFAAMLRRVGGFEYTRPVVSVDDLTFTDERFAVSALHRRHTLYQAHGRLTQTGAIGAKDRPGEDYVIVPDSRSAARAEELVSRLRDADGSLMVPSQDGHLRFRPSDRIYQLVSRQHANVKPTLYRDGILLREPDGTPRPVAIEAASYLDPVNAAFTHLRLRDTRFYGLVGGLQAPPAERLELSTLLQSLDVAYPDHDHYIDYDSRLIRPDFAVYALTRLLRNEVVRIADSIRELADVRVAMKPADYFDHNYRPETGTWQEDIQGARVIGNELPRHFSPGEIESAAIFGYGPFTYLALAIAAYMRAGSTIDISDLLPGNIDFAAEWFNGTADESHNGVYRTFGDLFRGSGKTGRLYLDCEDKLRTHGRLRVADLKDLPPNSVQVLGEGFVSCSSRVSKQDFYDTIRQKANILTWTPRSLMISIHMVGSGGWNNSGDEEGIKIPATNLSLQDIESAYRSAGMRIVNCTPLHADSGFREDYKGMVVVFAKPDTTERPWSLAA